MIWPRSLAPRAQHFEIVEQAEHDHDRRGQHQSENLGRELVRQGDGEQKGQVDRHSAQIGHRAFVLLELAVGLVDDPVANRAGADDRREVHAERERCHERGDIPKVTEVEIQVHSGPLRPSAARRQTYLPRTPG